LLVCIFLLCNNCNTGVSLTDQQTCATVCSNDQTKAYKLQNDWFICLLASHVGLMVLSWHFWRFKRLPLVQEGHKLGFKLRDERLNGMSCHSNLHFLMTFIINFAPHRRLWTYEALLLISKYEMYDAHVTYKLFVWNRTFVKQNLCYKYNNWERDL
jgi:hypothetical protein